ncbi:hypothetical protein [Azospirillum thermophilum]|nr:hypothetical protein [Azospirillum thermophilum]
MPEQDAHQLYVVEAARRRVVVSARDAGRARAIAAVMLLGSPHAPARDSLVVREPEEEEREAFRAREFGPGSEVRLGAIPL